MSEQHRFVMHTVSEVNQKGLDINCGGPPTLFDDARTKHNLLGVLPIRGNNELEWACVLPLQQPQVGEAFAGMTTPFTPDWLCLEDLDANAMAPNMRFVLAHLEGEGTAVGYNYCPDPRMRQIGDTTKFKFKPNSWDHFHMHWVKGLGSAVSEVGVGDKATIQAGPRILDVSPKRFLKEMFSGVIEDTLRQCYSSSEGLSGYIVSGLAKDKLPYLPEGGIAFKLPDDFFGTPAALSGAISEIHYNFARLHREVFSIFAENYDFVAIGGWQASYKMRSSQDVRKRLNFFTEDRSLAAGLARFYSSLKPETDIPNSMNWMYRGPAYSLGVYKQRSDYIISLLPHLMHPTNWLAALGVFEVRQRQGAELGRFRTEARRHALSLGAIATE